MDFFKTSFPPQKKTVIHYTRYVFETSKLTLSLGLKLAVTSIQSVSAKPKPKQRLVVEIIKLLLNFNYYLKKTFAYVMNKYYRSETNLGINFIILTKIFCKNTAVNTRSYIKV